MQIHFAYHFKDILGAAELFEPLAHFVRVERVQTPVPRYGAWSGSAESVLRTDALVVLWSHYAARDSDLHGLMTLARRRGVPVLFIRRTSYAPVAPQALPSTLIPNGDSDIQGALHRILARVRRRSREASHVSLPEIPKRPNCPPSRHRRMFRQTLVGLTACSPPRTQPAPQLFRT